MLTEASAVGCLRLVRLGGEIEPNELQVDESVYSILSKTLDIVFTPEHMTFKDDMDTSALCAKHGYGRMTPICISIHGLELERVVAYLCEQ